MRILKDKGILARWQDARHQKKDIDQPAPRPTAPHVVAARDMGLATLADTLLLPIHLLLTPPPAAAEAVGAVAGQAA